MKRVSGQIQKDILNYFIDAVEGKPFASIKELTIYHYCLWNGTPPTKNQLDTVRKVVRNLEKKRLVKMWRVKNKERRVDYEWKPVWFTVVTLPGYDLYPFFDVFELNRRKRPL